MSDTTIWPRIIAQYRRRHALTQSAFAERFGVTQQTVSRWESGTQAPHLEAQTALRATLGLGALSDSQAWIARVNETHGRETLFDADWRIAAISNAGLEFSHLTREAAVGQRISDLSAFRESAPILERLPFFEGNIRALKVSLEILLPEVKLRRDIDIWPVFTTDERLFIHVVSYDAERPKERAATGAARTNVLDAAIVLVDGTVTSLIDRAAVHE